MKNIFNTLKSKPSKVGESYEYEKLTDVDLNNLMKQIAKNMNTGEETLVNQSRDIKIKIAQSYHCDSCRSYTKVNEFVNALKNYADRPDKPPPPNLLSDLKSHLRNCIITDVEAFISKDGALYLTLIFENKLARLEADVKKALPANAADSLGVVTDCVGCISQILNTNPGFDLLTTQSLSICSLLFNALWCLNKATRYDKLQDIIDQVRYTILRVLSAIPMTFNENFSGHEHIIECLNRLSFLRNEPRFSCILQCLKSSDTKVVLQTLRVINTIIGNVGTGVDSNHEWQARIALRGEILRSGFETFFEQIKEYSRADSAIEKTLHNFLMLQDADFKMAEEACHIRREELSTIEGCLKTFAGREDEIIGIFQSLALVCQYQYSQSHYFNYADYVLRSCLFDAVNCVEVSPKLKYGVNADEALEAAEEDDIAKNLINKIREINIAKQECLSKATQLSIKVGELQKETKLLRAHIADPINNMIPPATTTTLCDMSLIPVAATSSFLSVTSTYPDSGFVVTTEGLPPVTGGPPPPPPPGGLSKTGPPLPPPPPSFLGKGGPPPPPGPPPLLGKGSGPPPPPLPVGLFGKKAVSGASTLPPAPFVAPLPTYLKERKTVVADKPLKKIHWKDYVISPIHIKENSLWADLDENQVCRKVVVKALQEHFSNDQKSRTISHHGSDESPSKLKSKKSIIGDDKVIQNAGIVFASFKLSQNQWKMALLTADESILQPSTIERILKILPEMTLMQKLAECNISEVKELCEAEQYLATFASIKGVVPRLKAIMLKQTWNERRGTLMRNLNFVNNLMIELMGMKSLRTFLNLVLFVGNYMNRSTTPGHDAYAIKLAFLTKLGDTKTTDPNVTLMHILTELMTDVFKKDDLPSDLWAILRSNEVDIEAIQSAVTEIGKEYTTTSSYIQNYKEQTDCDKFKASMEPFIDHMKTDVAELRSKLVAVNVSWAGVQDYFSITYEKKYKLKNMIADLTEFNRDYQAIVNDIRKRDKKNKKEQFIRKPLQNIQTNREQPENKANQELGFLESALLNIENGVYKGARLSKGNTHGIRKYQEPIDTKVEFRRRRIGQPTVLVNVDRTQPSTYFSSWPSTSRVSKENHSMYSPSDAINHHDENSHLPDATSLMSQLHDLIK